MSHQNSFSGRLFYLPHVHCTVSAPVLLAILRTTVNRVHKTTAFCCYEIFTAKRPRYTPLFVLLA